MIEVREAIGERKDAIQLTVKMGKVSRTQFQELKKSQVMDSCLEPTIGA